MDTIDRLLNELTDYGKTLADLIKNNKARLASNPDNFEYLSGKIDAYEVAYEDFVRRLKRVNSFTRLSTGQHG